MKTVLILMISLTFRVGAQSPHDAARAEAQQLQAPPSLESFNPLQHLEPINQDTTSSCWSFSTLSFMESEMARQGVQPVRLAMMYPVYQAFVEKARRYIQTRGRSRFAPGDLFTGVLKIVKKYGIVPQSAYPGQTRSCKTFNHDPLYAALDKYLEEITKIGNWDMEEGLHNIRRILDEYLGPPPATFNFKGQQYTPQSFLHDYCRLNPDDYRMFTSFTYAPFHSQIVLDVPDNWARDSVYQNLPLDAFYSLLKHAVEKGYSAAIDADISEPGRVPVKDVCFIPSFDFPQSVTQMARELRFENGATTDDHLMHIVGLTTYQNADWFLVKDSWRTAWDGRLKGYFMMRDDYVCLKVLAFVVHKDALEGWRQ